MSSCNRFFKIYYSKIALNLVKLYPTPQGICQAFQLRSLRLAKGDQRQTIEIALNSEKIARLRFDRCISR